MSLCMKEITLPIAYVSNNSVHPTIFHEFRDCNTVIALIFLLELH